MLVPVSMLLRSTRSAMDIAPYLPPLETTK